jgi:hypothetical protein
MNTTALENKVNATQIIGAIAQVLGPIFIDYVEPTLQLIISELMHNKLSSTIRKESTKTCAVLLDCLSSKDDQVKLLRLILPEIAAQLKIKIERTDFRSIKWLTHEL